MRDFKILDKICKNSIIYNRAGDKAIPNQPPTGGKGEALLKPKKTKPAIYTFNNECLVAHQRVQQPGDFKESTWGWVDLKELAEITGRHSENLLFNYWYVKDGTIFRPYHHQVRRDLGDLGLALALAIEKNEDPHKGLYEIVYFDFVTLFRHGRGHRSNCQKLLDKNLFVPAGWALAVIKKI